VSTSSPFARAKFEATGRGFALYVEGPRDRGLIEAWARRAEPALGRAVSRHTVILGGCRPARAAEHFRDLHGEDPHARAVCVLDRDLEDREPPASARVPGLEFYTWPRRHIESYLLVPDAIRRGARLPGDDAKIERFFRQTLPEDEEGLRAVDAKRIFGRYGPLAACVGRSVPPVRVARAMRAEDFHADVHELLRRLREALGLRPTQPAVVLRRS
jgi:hypothetical protein